MKKNRHTFHTIKKLIYFRSNGIEDNRNNFLIFITGPGGSGKSTFAKALQEQIAECNILRLDDYRLSRKERADSGVPGSNPDANNLELIHKHLREIKNGNSFTKPIYDAVSGETDKTELYTPKKYNLIDGELCLHEDIIDLSDLTIYLKEWLPTLFFRRMKRDIGKRGYSIIKSLKIFWKSNIIDFSRYYKNNFKFVGIFVKLNVNRKYKIVN